jgi:hypothetical protein
MYAGTTTAMLVSRAFEVWNFPTTQEAVVEKPN